MRCTGRQKPAWRRLGHIKVSSRRLSKVRGTAPAVRHIERKWYENDCQITEVYTNKAGAKNQRKTALYLALETMRRELTEMENVLGLTPKGLKLLKTKGLEKKKGGALAEALRKADGEV